MTDFDYCFLDLETTGIHRKTHRIIEVACIRVSNDKREVSRFETLVNPGRDVPNSFVHQIEPFELYKAPTFAGIEPALTKILKNSIVVSHNLPFDFGFLTTEYSKIDRDIPVRGTVCTNEMARQFGMESTRLANLCNEFGIEMQFEHRALDDALATAKLFLHLTEELGARLNVSNFRPKEVFDDSNIDDSGVVCVNRELSKRLLRKNLLNEYIELLPNGPIQPAHLTKSYECVLRESMEDRELLPDEMDKLYQVASANDLTRQSVIDCHLRFIHETAADYRTIGKCEVPQRKDLEKVVCQLLPESEIHDCWSDDSRCASDFHCPSVSEFADKTVCFTGTFPYFVDDKPVSKKEKYAEAERAGLLIAKGVTKKLDFLVVAQPFSDSDKAKKARRYAAENGNPRILCEMEFWRRLRKPVSSPPADYDFDAARFL